MVYKYKKAWLSLSIVISEKPSKKLGYKNERVKISVTIFTAFEKPKNHNESITMSLIK